MPFKRLFRKPSVPSQVFSGWEFHVEADYCKVFGDSLYLSTVLTCVLGALQNDTLTVFTGVRQTFRYFTCKSRDKLGVYTTCTICCSFRVESVPCQL